MNDPPEIHVIVPVRNDDRELSALLPDLLNKGWRPQEIRVVDACGDSRDTANTYGVKHLVADASTQGRARQMNLGAAGSTADAFLFLHADTRLPPSAKQDIRNALERGAVGGAFARRFDSPSLFLKFSCRAADLRGRLLGWFFGDQAIFARADAFRRLDGFPDLPLFEDLEFSRRLKRTGPTTLLRPPVLGSARRFDAEGPLRRTWNDLKLTLCYLRGHLPSKPIQNPEP